MRTREDNPVEPVQMVSVTVKKPKASRAAEGGEDVVESPPKKQAM